MSNICQNEKKYVSDLVGEEYTTWSNENIILDCGTGSGKTTFVLTVLGRYALHNNKTMLYLCNRKKLRKQIEFEVGHLGLSNIDVKSYQQLQTQIENEEPIKQYDYIIADECHYFFNDALFNIYTDLSYNFCWSATNCVLIYMSATAKSFYNILENKGRVQKDRHYTIPNNYSYVDNVFFFRKKELINILDNLLLNTEDKIVYFCNSKEKFKEVHEHYKDQDIANFVCSEYTKDPDMSKINQPDCIVRHSEDLITFDKRLLITTKAMDNGVDLKDKSIKHIITDIFDLESAVQCLGRKRILSVDDTCSFYIRDYQKNELILFQKNNENELKPAMMYRDNYPAFAEQYGKRNFQSKTINTDWKGTKLPVLNEVRYIKLLLDSETIKLMFKLTYRVMILNYLGDSITDNVSEISFVEICKRSELESFIEKHINQKLFKDEQQQLIDVCNLRDNRNRQQRGIKIINAYLEENHLQFEIISDRETTGRQLRYWLIKTLNK